MGYAHRWTVLDNQNNWQWIVCLHCAHPRTQVKNELGWLWGNPFCQLQFIILQSTVLFYLWISGSTGHVLEDVQSKSSRIKQHERAQWLSRCVRLKAAAALFRKDRRFSLQDHKLKDQLCRTQLRCKQNIWMNHSGEIWTTLSCPQVYRQLFTAEPAVLFRLLLQGHSPFTASSLSLLENNFLFCRT